jgi:hypothetical protein
MQHLQTRTNGSLLQKDSKYAHPPSETVPGKRQGNLVSGLASDIACSSLYGSHALPSHLLLWQALSSNKPPIILQPNKFENNDVLVAIISAILISRVIMAMLLVSMLKYKQETLLFVSVM